MHDTMHDKSRTLAEILELNPTADAGWLEMFSEADLAHYLEHLRFARESASNVRWIRRGNLAPVAMRECA